MLVDPDGKGSIDITAAWVNELSMWLLPKPEQGIWWRTKCAWWPKRDTVDVGIGQPLHVASGLRKQGGHSGYWGLLFTGLRLHLVKCPEARTEAVIPSDPIGADISRSAARELGLVVTACQEQEGQREGSHIRACHDAGHGA
jgi:hypothetical protein